MTSTTQKGGREGGGGSNNTKQTNIIILESLSLAPFHFKFAFIAASHHAGCKDGVLTEHFTQNSRNGIELLRRVNIIDFAIKEGLGK